MTSKIKQFGEFYELDVDKDLSESIYYNDDLAPTKMAQVKLSLFHKPSRLV